jgi:hypothetical protein
MPNLESRFHPVTVAEALVARWRSVEVDDRLDALLLHAECGNLGECARLDHAHAPL